MVKQNRTRGTKDAKSTVTRTNTAESVKSLASVQESKRERQIFRETDGMHRFLCKVDASGEKHREKIGFNEIFQNGLLSYVGEVPFTAEQIDFVIDNSFEVGVLVSEYRRMEDAILEFENDERINFYPEDTEKLIQCLKGIVKRRYAETIRDQKAAGIAPDHS